MLSFVEDRRLKTLSSPLLVSASVVLWWVSLGSVIVCTERHVTNQFYSERMSTWNNSHFPSCNKLHLSHRLSPEMKILKLKKTWVDCKFILNNCNLSLEMITLRSNLFWFSLILVAVSVKEDSVKLLWLKVIITCGLTSKRLTNLSYRCGLTES